MIHDGTALAILAAEPDEKACFSSLHAPYSRFETHVSEWITGHESVVTRRHASRDGAQTHATARGSDRGRKRMERAGRQATSREGAVPPAAAGEGVGSGTDGRERSELGRRFLRAPLSWYIRWSARASRLW
jgi:hypothetical protein